jgi:hypothetical protein
MMQSPLNDQANLNDQAKVPTGPWKKAARAALFLPMRNSEIDRLMASQRTAPGQPHPRATGIVNQFSTRNPSMRANSWSLSVTSVWSSAIA